MARYVIDSPTLLHLVDAGLHVHPGHQLVAPNWIRSEALELLLDDVRAGKRTEAAALEAHERMTEIKMRLLGDRVSRRTAWKVAREHDWSVLRDAEYLAITRLQADALITVDPNLAAVAQGVVAVADVDDLLAGGEVAASVAARCSTPASRLVTRSPRVVGRRPDKGDKLSQLRDICFRGKHLDSEARRPYVTPKGAGSPAPGREPT